jgi:APA family basic amino acid/polyamine antiporter
VVVSAFGTVVASALAMPRTQFVMADRGLFFQSVGRLSPRFQSPSVATWTIGAISILFVFAGDFQRLADRMVLGLWPFYVLCAIGVFILRRRRPELARPYRAWGFPLVTAAFIGVGLALMINALWHDPTNTAITFALLAAGLPIYWGWRKAGGRRRNDGTKERR